MPSATQVAYLQLCHRKLWLFSHGLQMEQHSELVAEGQRIHEQSYGKRAHKWREIQVEQIKIDHYDAQAQIIREVKKSRSQSFAHIAQVKYYLFVLERQGIPVSHGLLEYPKIRQTEEVWLSDADRQMIPEWEKQIERIVGMEECPPLLHQALCRRCAYHDFCYTDAPL